MTSRTDSSASIVRSAPPLVSAEFARYKPSDALCCPSARQAVRYRLERSGAEPLLVPVQVRTTRQ
jgi:hypothetical protein